MKDATHFIEVWKSKHNAQYIFNSMVMPIEVMKKALEESKFSGITIAIWKIKPKSMAKVKLSKGEHWVSGLSDCCNAPLKETDGVISILLCSECGMMCNKKYDADDEDDFPDDFLDDD